MMSARSLTGLAVTLLCALGIASPSARAASNGYICKILAYSLLADEGKLQSFPKDPIVGQTFSVDRSSGSIIGKYVSSEFWSPHVLDTGSDQESFMMIATPATGFMHVIYLRIVEFAKGSTKPFVLSDDGAIMTGTCE
jgi:hypothetical protein